jgi:putative spermidine/putrescine transport system substrate-binding protein
MHQFNRRSFLKAAGALAAIPATTAIPSLAHAADVSESNVIVGTWGGDYQRLLQQNIDPLIKSANLSAIYDTGSALARQTKMRAEKNARRSSLDVSLLRDNDMYQMFTEGTTVPIDAALVPNLNQVIPAFKRTYAIPHIFSGLVLLYDTEKIKVRPTGMHAMLDPAYKGRVGVIDDQYDYLTLAGALASVGNAKDLEAGRKFLRALRDNAPKVYPSTDALAAALKSGEIWLTPAWKARALQWKKAGLLIDYVVPKEGFLPATFEAGVCAGSKNRAAGFGYLNAMLNPAAQRAFAESMGYAPTIQNAALPPELQRAVGFSAAEMERMVTVDLDLLTKNKNGILDFWNKEFRAGL